MILLAPSILSADFARLGEAVRMAEEAGADVIHVDVMDGHFVPNLTLGPQAVASLKKTTRLPLDVHLMVERPGDFIPIFLDAGADWVSVHQEASSHLQRDVSLITSAGKKAGVALNPATPLQLLSEILPELDFVLVMSVNPGFGGQKFLPSTHRKISELREWIRDRHLEIQVEVDGGVDLENAAALIDDGAGILVMGAAVFRSADPPGVIRRAKEIFRRPGQP
jgi:ribulose-phosphate 3-epimerase